MTPQRQTSNMILVPSIENKSPERERYGVEENGCCFPESPQSVAANMERYHLLSASRKIRTRTTLDAFSTGSVKVTRSARRNMIRRGALHGVGCDKLLTFSLSYRIYRPELVDSGNSAPLLILHGGP